MSVFATNSPAGTPRAARRAIRPGRAGLGFVAAYVVLLVAFGVVPTVYAIYFAFTDAGNNFIGLSNFTAAAGDVRLLLAGLVVAVLFVARSGFFDAA